MNKTDTKTNTRGYSGGRCTMRDHRPASISIVAFCEEYESIFGVPITIDKVSKIERGETPVLASELDRCAIVLSAMTGNEITLDDLWERATPKDGK